MISISTVLILGAGASAEYGLPVGRPFKKMICGTRNRPEFLEFLESKGIDNTLEFIDRYRRSGISSPDRFIEEKRKFEDAGKYCIAKVLIGSEQDRLVFTTEGTAQPWYEYLVDQLDVGAEEYKDNRLSIMTFNYDRSWEYYLWNVIESQFAEDKTKVAQLWEGKPELIHLHGQLGEFDPIDGNGRGYDECESNEDLDIAADGIQIIYQVNPKTPAFDRAEALLRAAERIFFLGFGFDERNVRRLRVFDDPLPGVEINGTGDGLSTNDILRIRNDIIVSDAEDRAFTRRNIRNFLDIVQLTRTRL